MSGPVCRGCPARQLGEFARCAALPPCRLSQGLPRFTGLSWVVDGIGQWMLTVTLRDLKRDGVFTGTVRSVVPPRIDAARVLWCVGVWSGRYGCLCLGGCVGVVRCGCGVGGGDGGGEDGGVVLV
ncbi:winged helix-turn-helix transcriptional regulator, partial [Streptomyces sp. MBT49]|nr:winged helix-turn-helix transcriptional regulator [Streptomyces sp. MBT49]